MPSDTQAHDGTGKSILIEANYLGAIKQVPPLLEALAHTLPHAHYHIELHDHQFKPFDRKRVLRQDIARIQQRLRNPVKIVGQFVPYCDVDIDIRASGTVPAFTSLDNEHLSVTVPVDPLKFEERPLMSERQRERLRAENGYKGRHIILGGSLSVHEFEPFYTAVMHAHSIDPTVLGVIAPRRALTKSESRTHLFSLPRAREVFSLFKHCGQLQELYSVCDIAVIGDTLWTTPAAGGQNPLEPAFYGKRIVSGRWRNANEVAYAGLRESGLLTEVKNQEELNRELVRTIAQEEFASSQERANAFIRSQQGMAHKVAKELHERLYA